MKYASRHEKPAAKLWHSIMGRMSKYDSKGHFSLVDICSSSQVDQYGRPVV